MCRVGTRDGGQVVPLVLAVVAFAAVVALALVPIGRAAAERAQARAVADAVALAGAAEGEAVAREVADANDAELVSYHAEGTDVWVEVTVGAARGHAKARRELAAGPPG